MIQLLKINKSINQNLDRLHIIHKTTTNYGLSLKSCLEDIVISYKPEADLLGSAGPFPPPALTAGAAGLAGITALAFSNMATTWSLDAG